MSAVFTVKAVLEGHGFIIPEPLLGSLSIDEFTYPGISEVAASGTLTVNFQAVTTASLIFIRSNRTFTVNLTGVGATQAFQANGVMLLWKCAETSVAVVNTDGSNAAEIEVLIAGT